MLELLSLVCSSAFPNGTLSTCLSDTPILGSGHVLLYSLDTVPTAEFRRLFSNNVTSFLKVTNELFEKSPMSDLGVLEGGV